MLTKKKLAFIAEWQRDSSLSQSELARRAGATKKSAKVQGSRWMKDPEVLAEMERRTTVKLDTLEHSELEDGSVINGLLEVIDECKAAGKGSWQMQHRIRAWELIGKHRKMFTERLEVNDNTALGRRLQQAWEEHEAAEETPATEKKPAIN